MTDPIAAKYHDLMNGLAHGIDDILNGDKEPKKVGFVLIMAEFGEITDGRVNYISNGEREDMLAMVKEWLARAEGRYVEGSGKA
jgi:hypothetical protein